MAAGIEVMIQPGTDRFDLDDQRWLDQVAVLHAGLAEEAGTVSQRGAPQPGRKGAVDAVVLALGSSGALTAAVSCFKAWLARDRTRTLTVTWTDQAGTEQVVKVTGDNLDHTSFQALAEAVRSRLEDR